MTDLSAIYREDATQDETTRAYQHLIDTGAAWTMDGSTGRMAMELIEGGWCVLGHTGHRDAYGNYVPSRWQADGKGTLAYAREQRPDAWPSDKVLRKYRKDDDIVPDSLPSGLRKNIGAKDFKKYLSRYRYSLALDRYLSDIGDKHV